MQTRLDQSSYPTGRGGNREGPAELHQGRKEEAVRGMPDFSRHRRPLHKDEFVGGGPRDTRAGKRGNVSISM